MSITKEQRLEYWVKQFLRPLAKVERITTATICHSGNFGRSLRLPVASFFQSSYPSRFIYFFLVLFKTVPKSMTAATILPTMPLAQVLYILPKLSLCLILDKEFNSRQWDYRSGFYHLSRLQGLIPRWGRSPGVGNGNLIQYSCLENSVDREV